MNHIIEILNDYAIEATPLVSGDILGFMCRHTKTNMTFILDYTPKNIFNKQTILAHYPQNETVIFFVNVDESIGDVIALLESDASLVNEVLLYDATDELEFFHKDLWNLIITLDLARNK